MIKKSNVSYDELKVRKVLLYFVVFMLVFSLSVNILTGQETTETSTVSSTPPQQEAQKTEVKPTSEQTTPAKQGSAETKSPNPKLAEVAEILFVFLVLSIVFEAALTPIFNWRFFLARFDGKGLKTPITLAIALIVFLAYDLDIFKNLLDVLGYNQDKSSLGGQVLTAFLIAGGSDGILRIYDKLNIRDLTARDLKAARAKQEYEKKKKQAEIEKEKTRRQIEEIRKGS